ncbi:primosome assembly protein PriA [Pseudokineococcus basanitobsidens]|uniref:Probable replication restart protein PriA n=1 Tax=Pseudokineococcus basanitobsidens TaxID=1926649 RepID=A0ABU8RHZ2_9ACTN
MQPGTSGEGADGQLSLLRSAARGHRPRTPEGSAERDPVAGVVLDVPLPHLDRVFDYAVPASAASSAVVGARVRVRLAGQDVEGFVVERRATSEHAGALQPLRRVVSPEPVLDPAVLALARAVARRCAGTTADVLRLAVPPRRAVVETEDRPGPPAGPLPRPAAGPWEAYAGGAALVARVVDGGSPRAVWTSLPGAAGDDWPAALAVLAAAALAGGRGALLVVPDARDVARLDAALTALLGAGRHVRLTAEDGPTARYRAFVALRRGRVRAVVGTRAAALAPVQDLGLVVCWDDGDDLHAEPRAPYPHARDVLVERAGQAGAAAVVGSPSRSAAAQQLLADGWARVVVAPREVVRARAPRVAVAEDDGRDPAGPGARLPASALRLVRESLPSGPVLVQVPRAGYLPATACQRCRHPARCARCGGPLALPQPDEPGGASTPVCRWCATSAPAWACPHCGGRALRSLVVGSGRTAEELGRALPGTTVRRSGGAAEVLASVPAAPALVVATPGAEPVAEGGYSAALLLDTWALLSRAELRSAEEALRRWLQAASLVRPAADGGRVLAVGEAGLAPLQALVRWDPGGHAERELAERTELGLPPAAVVARVTGSPAGVRALLAAVVLPPGASVLGPAPLAPRAWVGASGRRSARTDGDEEAQALLRAPRTAATALADALRAARAATSARKEPPVRVHVDPLDPLEGW